MRKPFLLLISLLIMACRHQHPVQEAKEMEWHARIFAPAVQTFFRGDADSAVYRYDSIARSLKNSPVVTFMRYDLLHAISRGLKKDNAQAIVYLDSAIRYLEHHHLTRQYPRTYFGFLCMKGELALFEANYNLSYQCYLEAKQWASAYLTSCEIAEYSYNLGMVLYRQQKYTESSHYFRESADQYASCSMPAGQLAYKQQEIADNIGLCYVRTKQYDSALLYFNRALAIIRQNSDSLMEYKRDISQAVVWGNMAKVYVAQNKPDTAIGLFQKSLAINTRTGYDRMDAQLVQAQLAEVYEGQSRYADMLVILQQLRTSLDTLDNPAAVLSWNRLMAGHYRRAGDSKKEYKHYQAYIRMRDSISQVENAISQADISRQVREREQQLEIALLKKSNELNKTYLLITISLSVIAALVIVFFYYIFRKTARLNRLISAQKEELEQLNNVKNRLFSIVSHDLRAPVNSLSSFIDLLDDGDLSKESLIEYSQLLKKNMSYTSGMMENLLSWAASQLQGFTPSIRRAAIKEIADKVIHHATGLAAGKKIKLANDIPQDVPACVDRDMLQVVLRNLVGNAIKYSYPGGSVTIDLAATTREMITIRVKDQGIGMQPDDVEKINRGDQQMLRSTPGTARERGTGLGIHLCRIFVEMMKGTLWVESEPGKGTSFFISLPA
ncbi:MAG: tetratricopeptide repeat-containing sensor histidine kinase, partial [Chitinophagaceae bacterium]